MIGTLTFNGGGTLPYLRWWLRNSNVISLKLTDDSGGAVTGAEAAATLEDASGSSVWTDSLLEAVTGVYSIIVAPAGVTLVSGQGYRLILTATSTDGASYKDTEPVYAVVRSDAA